MQNNVMNAMSFKS